VANSVVWRLVADPTGYGRGFREADRVNERFARNTKKHFQRGGDDAGQQFGLRFNKRLGHGFSASTRIAKLAAGGIAGAFAAVQIGGFLKGAIDEAREAAKVGRQTNAVIKATGGVAKVSARDVGRLADSLSRKVGVDDEVIQAGANMLLTFKGVRNEVGRNNDIFNQASVAILDMTAALHQGEVTQQGLEKASIQVGKALNDPIKGIAALTRVGVTFTQGQKDQIKSLVESGRKMEAQKIILAELKSEFGGAAKAAADPWQRVVVAFKNVQEAIGKRLMPALASAAGFLTTRVLPAAERVTNQFLADFRPELGRLKFAWEENKGAILGFVTSLTGADDKMVSSKDAAVALADGLERLIKFGGDLATFGDRAAGHLNDMSDSLGKTAHGLRELFKITTPFGAIADKLDLSKEKTKELAAATDLASTAAERHTRALTGEKQALEELQRALDDEKTKELDLRQAKINVAVSQSRLNDLKRTGKTRSVDYKQAQIDLERAQLALRRQTDAYKDAQKRANAATAGAMTATQRATTPVRELGLAARTGGQRANNARVPWRKLGEDAAGAMARIKSKRARITANFGWQGLEVFRVGPKGQTRLAFAEGGEVNGPGTSTSDSIPARLSRGEHVWSAREVRGAGGHRAVEGLRREARGFAQGGTIPQFGMTGTGGFVKALNSWESRVTRILDVGAKAFGNTVKAIGGNPTIKRFILGTDPLPYRLGAAGPGAYDCSGLVGAVYGKLTGRGGGHGQRYFNTATISTAVPGLKPGLGGVFQIGVTPTKGHMVGRYGGLGFEAESTRTGIKVGAAASQPESFARHFHMARGGPVDDKKLAVLSQLRGVDIGGDAGKLRINGKVFDRGGYLMPGATLAVNRTGRPEPVGGGRLSREDARMIAQELAKVIPTTVQVVDVQAGLLKRKRNTGGVALGLS
jgi:hypothetical protein